MLEKREHNDNLKAPDAINIGIIVPPTITGAPR
jgi:hypothetical protein